MLHCIVFNNRNYYSWTSTLLTFICCGLPPGNETGWAPKCLFFYFQMNGISDGPCITKWLLLLCVISLYVTVLSNLYVHLTALCLCLNAMQNSCLRMSSQLPAYIAKTGGTRPTNEFLRYHRDTQNGTIGTWLYVVTITKTVLLLFLTRQDDSIRSVALSWAVTHVL